MKVKISKILVIIFISLFEFFSCKKTQIIWTDLRENPTAAEISISFLKTDTNSLLEKKLICGSSKTIWLPTGYQPHGFSKPNNLGFNYVLDLNQKKMEFFLMDYDVPEVCNYTSHLSSKEGVYAYSVMFVDEHEKKICTLLSIDNTINVDRSDILVPHTPLDYQSLLEQLPQKDVGYYYETDNLNQIEPLQCSYLVRGQFFNHFFWISPYVSGPVDLYLLDEKLPQWLIEKL